MRKLQRSNPGTDPGEHLGELVERFSELPGLAALLLFGSYGTDAQTPLSDVDLAVLFRKGEEPDARGRLELTGLATELLEEDDVSLTFLRRAPLPFQHEVLRTGRPLLVPDEVALADFREHVVGRYCDFVIDYRVILSDYDAFLRETHGSR